jgi:hypothetical protein
MSEAPEVRAEGSGKSTTIGVNEFTMGVEEGIGRREGR